jgi:V8-like Glu-specific endopeptidase
MCGKIADPDTNFVVNRSPRVHWPWMASYGFINEEKQWQHQCGATLISDQHFLTASHCVKKGVQEG